MGIEIFEQAWAVWILAAVVLGILELTLQTFDFLFAAVAALFTALIAVYFGGLVQGLFFVGIIAILLVFIRPKIADRLLNMPNKVFSRTQVLVGREGLVTENIDAATGQGRILVDGQDWAAKREENASGVVKMGDKVKVVGADGIVLVVKVVE